MTTNTANRINSAACRLWFFQQGLSERVAKEDVHVLKSVSVGQIQSASEVIEAVNEHAPAVEEKRLQYCVLHPDAARRLKAYADALQA